MSIAKPRLQDLSPDLQYQVWQRQQMSGRAFYLLLVPFVAYLAIPPVNAWVDSYIGVKRSVVIEDHRSLPGELPAALKSSPQKGAVIAGFTVTSPYGDRSDRAAYLPPGASLFHLGTDLATPIGTDVYAMGTTTVECWTDSGGGGLVAEVTSSDIPNYRFQLLHLADCFAGEHAPGDVIAQSGDSGIGAAHLDIRQEERVSGQKVPPYNGYIEWALTGKAPFGAPGLLVDKIKDSEGLSLAAYLDPVGIPTIGYGATTYPDGTPVRMGDRITQPEAEELLQWHMDKAAAQVEALVEVPLATHEKAALTDFTYNVGGDALAQSTLLQKLNQGHKEAAAKEFQRWVHGDGGKVLPGLETRRQENAKMFRGEL
ncbi:MAG: glycoside hydrolase family protein [Cyanobacteria bacterium J06626_23]